MSTPEQLRQLLASTDEEVRHAAVQGLRSTGALLPVLIEALGDASWRVRLMEFICHSMTVGKC